MKSEIVSFRNALLKGLAHDGGLYMPESIPLLTKEEISSFSKMEYHEIAFEIANKFLHNDIDEADLKQIVKDAYNFEIPLEKVYNKNYLMRLDQGPTASFKDFAARMMGRLMQYFLKKENRNLLILTATSGDTGSAIANAFYNLDNIKVVILYPKSEVTERQRKQMTTLQKNIYILALDGKFDDCQALVKKAFNDPDLEDLHLSSANSINIGRLLPQSMYYMYAYSRLCDSNKDEKIIFSVPSGNFGNLMGGLIAQMMGLPVKKFIIATNENKEVPEYFRTGNYNTIEPSLNCISSAMNVGHPSNIARIFALYGGIMDEKGKVIKQPDLETMKNDMYTLAISDETTKETIRKVYERHQVVLEPHGAVGWEGLQHYYRNSGEDNSNQVSVCLETAHPAKFPKVINEILHIDPELPLSLIGIEGLPERSENIENDYESFKAYLIRNN
jgi:threonine synthase